MSLIDGARKYQLTEFKGCQDYGDSMDVPTGNALIAEDCEFSPGSVRGRRGFAKQVDLVTSTQSAFYWTSGLTGAPVEHLSLLRSNTTVYDWNMTSGGETTVGTLGSGLVGGVFAQSGKRLYMCGLSSTGAEYAGAKVWDGVTASALDDCFQRPLLTITELTVAVTEPSAGSVTAGLHLCAAIFQTRTGYWTRPGPITGSNQLAATFIVSSGSKNISVVFTPVTTWPAWITALQLIITSALNNYQYYLVPNTITPITAGSATPVTVTYDLADIQLRAIGSQGAGTLADDYFNMASLAVNNDPPFKVKFVCAWGQRMVYVANVNNIDSLLISEQQNHQWISLDQHLIVMPGGVPIGSCFELGGVLYVLSPNGGMYSVYDNGGRPASFSPPQLVDGKVGSRAMFGTITNSNAGYALIGSPQGLYVFNGGAISQIPLTFKFYNWWKYIDWSTPWLVQTKDNPQDRLIYIRANLKARGARIASPVVFTIDYTKGLTVDGVNFSPWTIGVTPGAYPLGPIEVLKSTTYAPGLWLLFGFPSVTDADGYSVVWQKSIANGHADTIALYQDDFIINGVTNPTPNVVGLYQPTWLPNPDNSSLLQHVALRVRVKALPGTIATPPPSVTITGYSLDNSSSVSIATITSPTGGQKYLEYYDLQSEVASYLFQLFGCVLTELTHYYFPFVEQR